MATTTLLKTYEDLCWMPDDGRRYELIHGEIVVSPAPTWDHQLLLGRLYQRLDTFVLRGSLGWVAVAPLDIQLSEHDTVQPDIVYVSRARASIRTSNGTLGAPDLVVEVLSPSNRSHDERKKLELYAAAGVPEYWLADAEQRAFRALTLKHGRYEPIPHIGARVRSLILPGLEIDVDAVFADLL